MLRLGKKSRNGVRRRLRERQPLASCPNAGNQTFKFVVCCIS